MLNRIIHIINHVYVCSATARRLERFSKKSHLSLQRTKLFGEHTLAAISRQAQLCFKHLHTNPFTHKTGNNGSIKLLQSYPIVAADAPPENGTAAISAVLSLDERLSQTDTPLCLQVLMPIDVLLSYSAVPCQDTHC
jgi:hypothetical protein